MSAKSDRLLQQFAANETAGYLIPTRAAAREVLEELARLRAAVRDRQESDLDLVYIGSEGAKILAQAYEEEEISSSQVRWVWDTIGDLVGEVERLLISTQPTLSAPASKPVPDSNPGGEVTP